MSLAHALYSRDFGGETRASSLAVPRQTRRMLRLVTRHSATERRRTVGEGVESREGREEGIVKERTWFSRAPSVQLTGAAETVSLSYREKRPPRRGHSPECIVQRITTSICTCVVRGSVIVQQMNWLWRTMWGSVRWDPVTAAPAISEKEAWLCNLSV